MTLIPSRGIFNAIKSTLLRPASLANRTVLNFWSPGYKIEKIITSKDGQKVKKKVFVPTSTTEAAIAFLSNQYSPENFAKLKGDIHPGHSSVETSKEYLSVGTLDPVDSIGTGTHHELVHTDSFVEDILAFQRFPELRLDFYTLNGLLIAQAIRQFKDSEKLYSLLGDRFNFSESEGESCATASHLCLRAGGLDELLRSHHQMISRQTILTPALLTDFTKIARNKEFSTSEKSILFSESFVKETQDLMEKLNPELEKLSRISMQIHDPEKDNPNEPKPK